MVCFLVVSHDSIRGCVRPSVCRSVRRSVRQSVGRSVGNAFVGGQRRAGERLISCVRTCFSLILYNCTCFVFSCPSASILHLEIHGRTRLLARKGETKRKEESQNKGQNSLWLKDERESWTRWGKNRRLIKHRSELNLIHAWWTLMTDRNIYVHAEIMLARFVMIICRSSSMDIDVGKCHSRSSVGRPSVDQCITLV